MADTIAILGGGKIGEALLTGLLRSGRASSEIVVSERYPERAEYLVKTHGIQTVTVPDALAAARTVVIAVKPQDIDSMLAEMRPSITDKHLIVSVVAGIPSARMESALGAGVVVVRSMPNTPALVGQGVTAIAPGAHASAADLDVAETVLAAVGRVVRVTEGQLDAVTAVSGSGPAYFYFLVESMIEGGVLLGLPRQLATELAVQTAVGSAAMLAESGEHPVALREAVTSPGGTTIAAIRQLEAHGVRAAVIAAVEAASMRSAELGKHSPS
jgi:pyrroline-5-carboxylate reductase